MNLYITYATTHVWAFTHTFRAPQKRLS